MTEAWTGRKYQGAHSGKIYTILSEPFDFQGEEVVTWYEPSHWDGRPYTSENSFETAGLYSRVIGPKYAVGDKVRNIYGDVHTIDAASSRPDFEGEFVYLVLDSKGEGNVIWENSIESKVSE